MSTPENGGLSRRDVLKSAGQVAAASALAGIALPAVHAQGGSAINSGARVAVPGVGLWHGLALLFVRRLKFHAFFRKPFIPKDRGEIWLQIFHHFPDSLYKTEDRVCRLAARIIQVLDGVK